MLDAPSEFKHLGKARTDMIRERYSLEACLPKILELYEEVSPRSIQHGFQSVTMPSARH